MSGTAKDRVIIRNIYYMMAYAFRTLDIGEYAKLGQEDFDNLANLMAAILVIGISLQRKRGFERDYEGFQEDLHTVRGRIDLRRTARLTMDQPGTLACDYDEFSENTYKNRILKTTAQMLVRHGDVDTERRRDLKRCLIAMRDIETLDPARVEWGRLRYHRNNGSYQMLMNACYMVIHSLLMTQSEGEAKFATFSSSRQLPALYEKFVLEYYRRKHPSLNASAREIDRKASDDAPAFLPHLYTDITLERDKSMLIIDTKCYGTILGTHHDSEILSTANINQIVNYVVHAAYGTDKRVQGMLLYALTKDTDAICNQWDEIGHTFHVRTLDLGQEFKEIANQLDEITGLV